MKKLLWCIGILAASVALAEVRTYTAAQTIDEVLTGDDSIVINCPAGERVVLSGANTFSGGVTVLSGGVELAHQQALGAGRLACASGTMVTVSCSYRGAAETLTSAVIAKIDVLMPEAGEPWVGLKLIGEGLRNDVDFTGQPYLWLSGPETDVTYSSQLLEGIYEPCDHVYRFGYGGLAYYNSTGICVTNLVDGPNGEVRRVVCRGPGSTTFGTRNAWVQPFVYTFSGPVELADGHYATFFSSASFGVTPSQPTEKLILRDGALWRSIASSIVHSENFDVRISGNVVANICGSNDGEVFETFKGSIHGDGTLTMADVGGFAFYGTNNTFSGRVIMPDKKYHASLTFIRLGKGDAFSWGTGVIEGLYPQHGVIFESNTDVAFTGLLEGCLNLFKNGSGTLTLAGAQPARPSHTARPVWTVNAGAVRAGAVDALPASGLICLAGGTLDLGGIVAPSVCLPYGTGAVVNPPAGGMVYTGSPTNDLEYAGSFAGDVTIANLSDVWVWRLVGPSTLSSLTIAQGAVGCRGGVSVDGAVTVAMGARWLCGAGATACGALAGGGRVELDSDGVWPNAAASADFTGEYAVTAPAATTDGVLRPAPGATVNFAAASTLGSACWTRNGVAFLTNAHAAVGCQLVSGGYVEYGAINTREVLSMAQGWVLDFDLRAQPVPGYNLGDGFAIVFHQLGARGTMNGNYNFGRIGNPGYGIQCYLSKSDRSCFYWLNATGSLYSEMNEDGTGPAAFTNSTDVIGRYFAEEPMHVRMVYDTTRLIYTFSPHGRTSLCVTNVHAGVDLPAAFPAGASIGIWAVSGGWRSIIQVDNVAYRPFGAAPETPVLGGTLALGDGTYTLGGNGVAGGTLSAALHISGAATLAGRTAVMATGARWEFDLVQPTAKLTLGESIALAADAPITVALIGTPPRTRREIADVRAVPDYEALSFKLAPGTPASWRLIYCDGRLSVISGCGFCVNLR